MTTMRKSAPSARALAVGCLILLMLAVLAIRPWGTSPEAQGSTVVSPLDRYPGFGLSADAVLRDNTIAFWEAFQREQSIARCMEAAGFRYLPAVAFPTEAALSVASGLDVKASQSTTSPPDPAASNKAFRDGLSPQSLNRYNQSLVGESTEDLAEADRKEGPPPGRGDDFARGGCVGKAASSVGSIWTIRHQLSGSYDAMRRSVPGTAEFGDTRARFSECARQVAGIVASGPEALEASLSVGGQTRANAAQFKPCMDIWNAGYARALGPAAEGFIQRNIAILSIAESRYAGEMQKLSEDSALRRYLSEAVALAQNSGQDGIPRR